MSDQTPTPQTFTATQTAEHAEQLRGERDKTDADVAADFPMRVSADRVAAERGLETQVRARWEAEAIQYAVTDVVQAYLGAGGQATYDDHTHASPPESFVTSTASPSPSPTSSLR
jgi:hypothetical protein